jgi:hypothetical protein
MLCRFADQQNESDSAMRASMPSDGTAPMDRQAVDRQVGRRTARDV